MEILVKKARRRDKEAFSQLMRGYGPDMYRTAIAILKNDADAADAMQETALTCWEKLDTLKRDDYFKTWMMRILINQCNAIYKQKKRYVSDEMLQESAASDTAYDSVEWRILLENLEEKYRTVIILYYVEGFKVREIARILDISESAVKGRLVTAREKVEKLYRPAKEVSRIKKAACNYQRENGFFRKELKNL